MNIFYQLDGLRRMKIWSGKNTKKWSRYYKLFSIIEFLIRLLVQHMHSNNEPKSKCSLQLIELISKIGRLRKRLISCGYSHKQVIDIIFEQFLRLPEIDWSHLQETKTFYELKTKFKAGSNSAEIILRLQKIVPNLHTSEVCQYLLTVLEVNAESFGFNLAQSSSESNDSGSGMQRLAHKRIRRRHKNLQRKEQIINHYRKAENQLQEGSKKVHHDEEYNKKKKAQNDINLYFKNKPVPALLTFEECQLDKEMKKMPESEDSDNI